MFIKQVGILVLVLGIVGSTGILQAQTGYDERSERWQPTEGESWDWLSQDETDSQSAQDFKRAWDAVILGDYEGALAQVDGLKQPWSYLIRAMARVGLEEYDIAVVEARKAVDRLPESGRLASEAHNQVGLALMRPVLAQIHAPADPAGAFAALEEAELSFLSAYNAAEGDAAGLLLNLSAAMIGQSLLVNTWNRWTELDQVLRSVGDLLPEHSEWAKQSLENDPTLPEESAFQAAAEFPQVLDDGRQLYVVGGDVVKPRRISAPQPHYSEAARKARIQGNVYVQAVINQQGRVSRIRVVRSLDADLDHQAMKAISQWRFKPAMRHGQPVSVVYNLTVSFRLQ